MLPERWVRAAGTALVVCAWLVLPGAGVWEAWWAKDLRPEMILIPAGTFMMGSPEGEVERFDDELQHEVTLSRAYLLSKTEVTQGMWARVMGEMPACVAGATRQEGADLPMHCVSWEDAVRFCNRLSELEGLAPAYDLTGEVPAWRPEADGYRLPTEAEWERAARAGTGLVYAGTSEVGEVCQYGNVSDSVFDCSDGFARLAPVGRFQPNAWGVQDMTGNVWEWTWGWYTADLGGEAAVDPLGPASGGWRVRRGGSWRDFPAVARVASRDRVHPSVRFVYLGFRLARSPSALPPSHPPPE